MASKIFYYARVSSKGQKEDRQIEAFKELGAGDREIFTDKESGKDLDRPQYLALRNGILRTGDTLVIKELDRLSRSKSDIKNELEYFKANGIRLKVIDIPTTMTDFPEGQEWVQDMINNILIEVLGSIAEEERRKIRKRQQEGISIALENGIEFGRPKAKKPDNWDDVITQWQSGTITAVKAMELTATKKTTFYKLLKQQD